MIFDTLCITDMWLQTIYKEIDAGGTGIITRDLRGSHNSRTNLIPDAVKDSVRNYYQ